MKNQVSYLGNTLGYEINDINKPVCICFHGLNMTSEMFKTNQLKHLLEDYSLILVDLCGYGNSIIDINNFDMIIFNQLVLKLLKKENIKTCTMLGYCLGGVLALDFTIRNPQIVTHLILLETMIYLPKWLWITTLPGYQNGYQIFQKQTWLLKILEIFPVFTNISSPQRIKTSQAIWNRKVNVFYLKLMRKYERLDHLKRCQKIKCYVDIIYNHYSFKNIKKTAYELSQFSFVKLYQCKGKGHFLFLDETLNEIVLLKRL